MTELRRPEPKFGWSSRRDPFTYGEAYGEAGVVPGDRVNSEYYGMGVVLDPQEAAYSEVLPDQYIYVEWDKFPGDKGRGGVGAHAVHKV